MMAMANEKHVREVTPKRLRKKQVKREKELERRRGTEFKFKSEIVRLKSELAKIEKKLDTMRAEGASRKIIQAQREAWTHHNYLLKVVEKKLANLGNRDS